MATPNWPIRVGGVYESDAFPELITRRVTAIDGDNVHFEKWYSGGKKPYSVGELDGDVFRVVSLPEDQSPIPELLAALKKVRDYAPHERFPFTQAVLDAIARAEAL